MRGLAGVALGVGLVVGAITVGLANADDAVWLDHPAAHLVYSASDETVTPLDAVWL
jgi:hypothetical protein